MGNVNENITRELVGECATKIFDSLSASSEGFNNQLSGAFYTMSIGLDKFIYGDMNPESDDKKVNMKSDIRDLFILASSSDNKVISLSKSGNTKDNCEYFDKVFEEFKNEYPEVKVENLFDINFKIPQSNDAKD